MQETRVWPQGQEDPLEEGMATHSSIYAWRIPRTEAWQATVHGVPKNWAQMKQLSTCALNQWQTPTWGARWSVPLLPRMEVHLDKTRHMFFWEKTQEWAPDLSSVSINCGLIYKQVHYHTERKPSSKTSPLTTTLAPIQTCRPNRTPLSCYPDAKPCCCQELMGLGNWPNLYLGITCFIELHRYYIFYKLKVCGNLAWSKSIDIIFQQCVLISHLCIMSW